VEKLSSRTASCFRHKAFVVLDVALIRKIPFRSLDLAWRSRSRERGLDCTPGVGHIKSERSDGIRGCQQLFVGRLWGNEAIALFTLGHGSDRMELASGCAHR
jgi:hypothetical protein